jgi:hypothetical protein
MSTIPAPGDLAPGFTVEHGQCWAMVFDEQIQGAHCPAPVVVRGRFRNHTGMVWTLWSCAAHSGDLEHTRAAVS